MTQDLGDGGGMARQASEWAPADGATWTAQVDWPRPASHALTFLQRGFLRTGLGSLYLALAFWTLVLVISLRALAMYVGGTPGGAAHHPDVFAEMYWLSMPVIPVLALASGWTLRRFGRSWLTTLTASGALASALVLLVPWLAASAGPHMLAWTTLGLHRIAVLVAPLILLAGSARLLVATDRFARRDPFRAGAVGVGAMAIALALSVPVFGDSGHNDDTHLGEALERSLSVEPVNLGPGRPAALRGLYLAFAMEVAALEQGLPVARRGSENPSRHWAINVIPDQRTDAAGDPFGECILMLHEMEADQQRRIARVRGLPRWDVEDLIMTAMLKVCERYALGRVAEPRSYLQVTVYNALMEHYRARRRVVMCDIEPTWAPRQEVSVQLQEVQHAMCGLTDRERVALEMQVQGYRPYEIARELGVTEANARQIVSRSRGQIRQSLR